MKKLLMVIDNLGSGGAQNQITLLAKELCKREYKITLITYYPQDFYLSRISNTSITHIQLKKSNRIGLNVLWSIRKIIQDGNFDVLLSFLDTPNFYLSLARSLLIKRPPIVISYRSQTMFDKMGWLELQLKKLINKNATAIVVNSHHERESWVSRYPNLKDKFYTIYNAVDFTKFKSRPRSSKNKPLRVLCVGSVCIDKNGMVVIEALNSIINQHKIDLQLTWVGEKQKKIKSRKEYIDLMERAIEEFNLNGQWKWKKPISQINEAFLDHDVLVHASSREGLPNVVCEALSCGLPVILSDILDHPILANGNKNGFLFNPNNSTELVEAILKMRSSTNEEYQLFHKNSISFAKENFNIDQFVNSFIRLFK